MAFADPPFNIGYEYDQYADRLESDKYLEWSRQWMSEICRVLKSDGTFWMAIGDEYAAEPKVAATQLGFHTRNWVICYYTFGVLCKNKFTRPHAHLFYFVKDPQKFTFDQAREGTGRRGKGAGQITSQKENAAPSQQEATEDQL